MAGKVNQLARKFRRRFVPVANTLGSDDGSPHVDTNGQLGLTDVTNHLLGSDERRVPESVPWHGEFDQFIAICELQLGRTPNVLDWHSGALLANLPGVFGVASPLSMYEGETLPYLSKSFDVVAVSSSNPTLVAEACRVASLAIVQLPSSNIPRWRQSHRLSIQWMNESAQPRLPSTSIIIPTFNSARLLEGCVEQLAQTLPTDLDVQIVVVDDASGDDTWDMIRHLAAQDRRILPLRNKANMGFPDTCNYGAAEASGDVLFFLNADTKPQPGWLPPLLRRLRSNSSIGAVGSMLIYPDGTLQEAGAIVFSDGTGANFGRGLHPDHPLVSYAREVDYCSGAALAIWRTLFDRLDGFDQLYRPAYYEDTDLCMRVWEAGFKVIYEPESRIIHLEGSVHGTDVSTGGKRYQVRNRENFVKRWKQQLVSQLPSPSDYDLAVWYDLAAWRPPPRKMS